MQNVSRLQIDSRGSKFDGRGIAVSTAKRAQKKEPVSDHGFWMCLPPFNDHLRSSTPAFAPAEVTRVLHEAFEQSQNMPLEASTRRILAIAISELQAGQVRTQPLPFFAEAIFAGFFVAISLLLACANRHF